MPIPESTAIALHNPNIYPADLPADRIPRALDSPSGKFERKIAASMAMLMPWPPGDGEATSLARVSLLVAGTFAAMAALL
jgi:hypothetical protein